MVVEMPGALIVWVAFLAGCGGTAARLPGDVARPFEVQCAAVRAGTSSRIVADSSLTDADWESLRGLAGLRELVLQRGVADDAKSEILATLPDIERLVLRESPLSDAGFQEIARCRRLTHLNVPQAACTAEGVRELRAVSTLRSLRIGGPNLTGREVGEAVAEIVSLESLHLIDVAIGDEGLTAIAGLPALRNLYLDGARVSDEAWSRYFEGHPDTHVHVDQAHHDRDPGRGHDGPRANAATRGD
jgi:hypothetical protein